MKASLKKTLVRFYKVVRVKIVTIVLKPRLNPRPIKIDNHKSRCPDYEIKLAFLKNADFAAGLFPTAPLLRNMAARVHPAVQLLDEHDPQVIGLAQHQGRSIAAHVVIVLG